MQLKKLAVIGAVMLVLVGCTSTTQPIAIQTGSDVSITCPISVNDSF